MTPRPSYSERDTEALGRELAAALVPGTVVLIDGPLGAGKTAFVRGLAAGLGCDPAEVSSPTFTIIQEYPGRLTLQHIDLYRLTAAEVDDLGLDELIEGNVVAVEWPERWSRPPAQALRVVIDVTGPHERRVLI